MEFVDSIREFLDSALQIPGAGGLDPDLPLVQRGVIDSIELIQLVSFLEKEFGITVDETEVVPSNLRTLRTMAAFVARKKGQ